MRPVTGETMRAIDDVEVWAVDLRLIERHRTLILLHDIDLILVWLTRDRILFHQCLIARDRLPDCASRPWSCASWPSNCACRA